MKNILARFFPRSGKTQAPAQSGQDVSAGLRSMVLKLSPAEIGISTDNFPHQAWGVVMETGMKGGYYTLVVLADGTTSLYFSNGGGTIGAGERPEVRKASEQFLDWGNRFVESAKPSESVEPPNEGATKFFFLTFNGVQSYAAREVDLGEKRDSLSPLFHAGHLVIAAVRQAQPQA